MMLDSGLLHCVPHPGNLLRTSDGRLCILDWGLVIRVDSQLQYALIEYIAHLTTADYSAIPRDLEALGFVPRGREAEVRASGVVDVLTGVLAELSAAGGVAALDINKIIEKLVDITKEYGALFQIPPYFAYIIRAYTVLEGIGLQTDRRYSILTACYPYLARRLLTDPSPRTQKALKNMLYGTTGADRIDLERLASMAEGAQDFSASTSSAVSETAAKDLLEIVLAPEGNYVQEVLLEEVAVLIEAFGREAIADFGKTPAGRIATSTLSFQKALADQLGFASVFALPLVLPGQIASQVKPLVALTAKDLEILKSVRKLVASAGPAASFPALNAIRSGRPLSVSEFQELVRQGLQVVQQQGPSARVLFNRLLGLLQGRVKDRVRIAAETALAASLERELPEGTQYSTWRPRTISLPAEGEKSARGGTKTLRRSAGGTRKLRR